MYLVLPTYLNALLKSEETVLQSLQSPLEELVVKEEKGKQCLASEVLAGVLHSDVKHILEAWDNWLCAVLRTGLRQ